MIVIPATSLESALVTKSLKAIIIRGVAREKHRAQLDPSGCFVSCDSVVWKNIELEKTVPCQFWCLSEPL